jgi:hypothetical protein
MQMVEALIKVQLKPWKSPNVATAEAGEGEQGRSIAVRDLDEGALREMAERWLDDLYTKTDFHNPFQARPFARAA